MQQQGTPSGGSPPNVAIIIKSWTDAKFATEAIEGALNLPESPLGLPLQASPLPDSKDDWFTSHCGTVWTYTAECLCRETVTGGCNCTDTFAGTACEP